MIRPSALTSNRLSSNTNNTPPAKIFAPFDNTSGHLTLTRPHRTSFHPFLLHRRCNISDRPKTNSKSPPTVSPCFDSTPQSPRLNRTVFSTGTPSPWLKKSSTLIRTVKSRRRKTSNLDPKSAPRSSSSKRIPSTPARRRTRSRARSISAYISDKSSRRTIR